MMCDILPILSALSRCFQTRDGVYSSVGSLVNGSIATIRALRNNPGQHYSSLPNVMTSLSNQSFRFKEPSDQQEEVFRKNVYEKFIDSVISNLEGRFPDFAEMDSFNIFNAQAWPEDQEELNHYGNQKFKLLSERFMDSLDNEENIEAEFKLFKNTILNNEELKQAGSSHVMEEAAGSLSVVWPNLSKIAAAGLLIPASTADCERGFSALKRIKNDNRNRLFCNSLNSLLMIFIEGPPTLNFNFDKAVTKWAGVRKRRLFKHSYSVIYSSLQNI